MKVVAAVLLVALAGLSAQQVIDFFLLGCVTLHR
jgi:hypothetical protein